MKTKERIAYKHKTNSREILKALIGFPNYCSLLLENKKPYDELLSWILNFAKSRTEDTLTPDIKIVAKEANVSYNTIAKHLNDIYHDIFNLNFEQPKKFLNDNENICCVNFNYLGAYAYFNIGFYAIPRVGEQLNFAFIIPKIGSDRFWVKDVEHEMSNGFQFITIDLTYDEPNYYLQLLKEKAYLHHELDWMEYRSELHSETKERLIRNNRNL